MWHGMHVRVGGRRRLRLRGREVHDWRWWRSRWPRQATLRGSMAQGLASPDTQLQLAKPAAAQGELITAGLLVAAPLLYRLGGGRPWHGVGHAATGLRVKATFEEAKLLRAPARSRGRGRSWARSCQAGASERGIRAAAGAPEGIARPHEAMGAVSDQRGAAGIHIGAAMRCSQAPSGGPLVDAARRGASRGVSLAAAARGAGGVGGPAALDGSGLSTRGMGVASKPLTIVGGEPSDPPKPFEGGKGLIVKVLEEVNDVLVDRKLPGGDPGLIIGKRVAQAVCRGHGLAVTAHDKADLPCSRVRWHPRDRGRLNARVFHVIEQEAEDPRQRALGSAGPGASCRKGIDAGFAIAVEATARPGESHGLKQRPCLGPGDIRDVLRGSATSCGNDVPLAVEDNEGPSQPLGIRVAVVDPGPVGVDGAEVGPVESLLVVQPSHPGEGAIRRRALLRRQI